MRTMSAMSPKEKKLLDWLRRSEGGMLLESQVVGSGLSKALNELLLKQLVDLRPHPTVVTRSQPPLGVTAVVLLPAGHTQDPLAG